MMRALIVALFFAVSTCVNHFTSLNDTNVGLLDFFKKGVEKPVEKKQDFQKKQELLKTTQPRTYTIKSGDSLSKIAKQFYGDASAWNKIYQANQDTIKNPDLIHPGKKIIIP